LEHRRAAPPLTDDDQWQDDLLLVDLRMLAVGGLHLKPGLEREQ
jgi:hypothetical protein